MSQLLDEAMQSLQKLQRNVQAMPSGEDLEALIEEGLVEVDRQCYEAFLDARGQSQSAEPAAFSPSRVSAVRRGAGARSNAAARSADAARGGAL